MGDGWRDRSNTAATLRSEFDAAGFPWLSYHGLRRAAVTALADHLPIRAVADYAGHKSIRTTLDNYIGRSAISAEVAKYL
jgi:integrase